VQTMTSISAIEKKKVAVQKAYLLSCVNSRLTDLEDAASVLHGKKVAAGVKFYVGAASAWVQQEAERRGVWQTLLQAGAIALPPSCGPCIGLGTGLLEKGEVGISATNRNFKGRMGSRDAQCYLASPEIVAASAVAGYITGSRSFPDVQLTRTYQEFPAPRYSPERVEILPGFPERLEGRLVFMCSDNINTDAIYGKDYTYRDDMTPEMMAGVIMENYDPQFAARTRAGDVIVGGFNFGTGSSREQAVTCLKAKGIPLVIAASFSQTYLRNAYNNGFLCIEVPALVKRLREQFGSEIAGKDKTIVPGDTISIDFVSSTLKWRGESFVFPPLGRVPQSLVIAGGAENVVAKKLGFSGEQEHPEFVVTGD
jgi:homoaconitate hydratase